MAPPPTLLSFQDGSAKETLLVFDGSPSSSLSLGQLVEAAKDTLHRKLMVEPTVLFYLCFVVYIFVYFQILFVALPQEGLEIVSSKFRSISQVVPFKCYFVHISDALMSNIQLEMDPQSSKTLVGRH